VALDISPLGVLLAALSAFLIGGLWYSALFAKPWRRAAGVADAELATGALRIFAGSFVLALVIALSLAAFIGHRGVLFGTFAGLAAGATFVAPALGVNYLFERRSLRLLAINAGYNAVAFTAMGAILGAFQG
jgi:hypothetical protein